MLEAVTFDFWNTLFREPAGNPANKLRVDRLTEIIRRHGHQIESLTVVAELRLVWEYAMGLQRKQGLEFPPEDHVRKLVSDLNIAASPELVGELYRAYTEVLLDVPPILNEGATEVLSRLADKYRLGLICNTGATPGSVLVQIMERAGIRPYFQTLTFSNELLLAKPNPAIFAHTLQNLAVEPANSVHIGDDAITDIGGALGAGMQAIWLKKSRPDGPTSFFTEGSASGLAPLAVVEDLTEVLNLI